ncbi:MAG: septum formation protein Maf [Clostridia bacterium]|nr:septum formation protein Maf [Clostridia bacterium]
MEPLAFSTPKIDVPSSVRVVLASASPRRKELCTLAGLSFEIKVADCDETFPLGTPPVNAVELLARRKGEAVAKELPEGTLVIASDTLVELDGAPLGKPKDEKDALRMLTALSGNTHYVRTGVAVFFGGRVLSSADSTAVTFYEKSEADLLSYIKTGEPADKAGAYAIQGIGSFLVKEINGSYDTVVGLCMDVLRDLIFRILQGEGEDYARP